MGQTNVSMVQCMDGLVQFTWWTVKRNILFFYRGFNTQLQFPFNNVKRRGDFTMNTTKRLCSLIELQPVECPFRFLLESSFFHTSSVREPSVVFETTFSLSSLSIFHFPFTNVIQESLHLICIIGYTMWTSHLQKINLGCVQISPSCLPWVLWNARFSFCSIILSAYLWQQ